MFLNYWYIFILGTFILVITFLWNFPGILSALSAAFLDLDSVVFYLVSVRKCFEGWAEAVISLRNANTASHSAQIELWWFGGFRQGSCSCEPFNFPRFKASCKLQLGEQAPQVRTSSPSCFSLESQAPTHQTPTR